MAASTQLHTSYWIEHGYIGVGLMEMMRTLGSGLGHGEGGVWKPSLHLSVHGLNTFTGEVTHARPGRLLETSAKATSRRRLVRKLCEP